EPLPPKPIILPEAEAVGDDYFSSILFVGDSRTQGLQIATGGYGASFYADRGLAIDGMGKTAFITVNGANGTPTSLTVIDALRATPHDGKIYINLGLNSVGWNSTDRFRDLFRTDLDTLVATCPNTDIVLMSILPVGRNAVVIGCSDNSEVNRRVTAYNQVLLELATEYDLYYLNAYEAFVDNEGFLPVGFSNDDIHLRRDQNILLCDYIRTHPIPSIFER
ncbi:MAG: SGNH/GDSL hydrolase family protein, partial [Clostridia bacterium]|nr:SGNH/GDSL hydrolase family protein [Clostridia bacterium]